MLSVIIPTLNAAKTLPACLEALNTPIVGEIIIVDAGSTDGTRNQATIHTSASRGGQLRAGAQAATGDWILLLHADTILGPGWAEAAQAAFATPETARYFRFRLASPDLAARVMETIVSLRCRLLRLPYGDQALLISKALLASVGGVPDMPLMEDVALARRLRRHLAPLAADAITAADRYKRDGWLRRPLRNIACLALYFFGISPARIKTLYG